MPKRGLPSRYSGWRLSVISLKNWGIYFSGKILIWHFCSWFYWLYCSCLWHFCRLNLSCFVRFSISFTKGKIGRNGAQLITKKYAASRCKAFSLKIKSHNSAMRTLGTIFVKKYQIPISIKRWRWRSAYSNISKASSKFTCLRMCWRNSARHH